MIKFQITRWKEEMEEGTENGKEGGKKEREGEERHYRVADSKTIKHID